MRAETQREYNRSNVAELLCFAERESSAAGLSDPRPTIPLAQIERGNSAQGRIARPDGSNESSTSGATPKVRLCSAGKA